MLPDTLANVVELGDFQFRSAQDDDILSYFVSVDHVLCCAE
jgi:hypothetical protein